jgi:hypothetical protein
MHAGSVSPVGFVTNNFLFTFARHESNLLTLSNYFNLTINDCQGNKSNEFLII